MEIFAGLGLLLTSLPAILAHIAGIVLALVRWQKHQMVSTLLLISLGLGLASIFIFPLLQILLLGSGSINASELGGIYTVWNIFNSIMHAFTLGLLLWAALGWRSNPVT